ncbi:M81 family metallopeptidase [Variovorax rhizosphaerae]|uniref:Microcystinase C n=1 Tax=Variovorax rhizosphaerae TaxID=1836200 RepID=A0ABU8WUN3_9BURK
MSAKVLSAQLSHETNTFSQTPTTLQSFAERVFLKNAQIAATLSGTACELAAHIDAARDHGWQLVQPLAAHATPSGRATRDTWRHLLQQVMSGCSPDLDGVILALHGAMAAEGENDAEGALLMAVREIVGPKVPIVVTLDLHANVTDRMAECANAIYAYRTYPHIDQYAVAREAADCLQRLMHEGLQSRCVVVHAPSLDGCDHGRTHLAGVMTSLLGMAADLRRSHEGVTEVAVCAGFPWADIEQAGPSVTVSGTASAAVLRRVGATLTEAIWSSRHETSVRLLTLHEMVQALAKRDEGEKAPMVISDFTDNPGHGAPGDGVRILAALLAAGQRKVALAGIYDAESAAACAAAGVGAQVHLRLGNKQNPAVYGEPLAVTGTVLRVGDAQFVCDGPMWAGITIKTGLTAVIEIAGLWVIVTSNNMQTTDRQAFLSQGIDPTQCAALVVKSQQHFRGAFDPIASRTILVDSGGAVSPRLRRLPYQRVRRPVWPLDDAAFSLTYSGLRD